METKLCCGCNEYIDESLFNKNQNQCKSCRRLWYLENRERLSNDAKINYKKNSAIILETQKKYYQDNRDVILNYQKEYRDKNKEYITQQKKDYYQKNKDKIKKYTNIWAKKKYANDPLFRDKNKLKSQIKNYLREKDGKKLSKVLEYNVETFHEVIGIPKKGEDIDHKIPISWFKHFTPIHIIWHLDNLQILPAKENQSKRNYYSTPIVCGYYDIVEGYIKEEFIGNVRKI